VRFFFFCGNAGSIKKASELGMWNMRGKKFGELQEKFWNGYFCRIYMRQIDGYFAGFSGLQCLLEISYKDD
jgi:hypothetical protein